MSSNYKRNKKLAIFKNTEPSLTDQSQAVNTDINVIIRRIRATGQAPMPGTAIPMSGDFTTLPRDLRGLLELAKSAEQRRRELPAPLRNMPIDELLALTEADIKRILTPPAKPTDKPAEQPPAKPEDKK